MRTVVATLLLLAGPAMADLPDSSLRPQPNPVYLLDAAPATLPDAAALVPDANPAALAAVLTASLRPQPRPASLDRKVAAAKPKPEGLDLKGLVEEEPVEVAAPAPKGKKKKKETASKKGSVCGVNAIKGEAIATIKSRVKGCGLKDGVRVTSVSGVRLSQSITVDCTTATALNTWVSDVLQPAYKGDIVELKIAAHYICRTRNNVKGAKVSEHGRGKAVDIGGFVLSSGKLISVQGGFNKTMRKAHKGACGIFGTTLGPGSDGYHEDHLHFDTAANRSGPYCR